MFFILFFFLFQIAFAQDNLNFYFYNFENKSKDSPNKTKNLENLSDFIDKDDLASSNLASSNETKKEKLISGIIITEFLPNPIGNDKGKEFIEIFNGSNKTIDLNKIKIKVGKKKINLSGFILPKEYLVITNDQFNFTIRNKGEILSLYLGDKEIFTISYKGRSPEGKSFSRLGANFW